MSSEDIKHTFDFMSSKEFVAMPTSFSGFNLSVSLSVH